MRSFDQFLAVLNEIPDPRRAEGKLYKLPYLLDRVRPSLRRFRCAPLDGFGR